MVGEEKRHQMMQNLFGDQSEEEEEEEEEVESEHESNRQPDYASDEGDEGPEAEGEGEVEGQGEAEIESEGEPQDLDPLQGESEGERDKSSQELEIGNQREQSEERYSESDDKEDYGQRVVTSRRHDAVESGSERSGENHYVANEDDEVNQARSHSVSGDEKDEDQFLQSAPEIRDVFGDSDDEELAEYKVQDQTEEDEVRSPIEEMGNYGKDLRPEDMIPDEDAPYYSEEEHIEARAKEKPVGPPLELEIPLCPPPSESEKMNMIKVSNIMGIDPTPFDPHTYVEEDHYETEESGSKKRIRLENNVVRWRKVKHPDGRTSIESNARFVEWSDGSLQLLIGNEVLDISKQDAQHEQAHLFVRHGRGILQSQGRILKKMRFMPSSLASNSHRLLTALVDSRHKKVYKVKNCITDIDPEREKEQKEKAVHQSIKANELLSRKKEKVSRKYTQPIRRERQLSPGFLEDALEEEDEQEYYEPRRSAVRRRFDDDLEMEARAEKRIINAKKGPKDIPRKSTFQASKSSRRPVDFSESEKEESEYETEGEEEGSPPHRRHEEAEQDYGDEDEEPEQREQEEAYDESEEEAEEPKQKVRDSGGSLKRKGIESDEDSPPRKATTHRRMKMVYESDED
ncbi:protein LEO1 homolog [Salvia miltiorrhiza]|uniref:protein LEO1 homolog n=1 Tax=Salvia miltiorrhiza TaxID=226208 RepID=UPI0025AD8CFC|nr:protein LEO1 homolog [Salvia miltiorrhiza]XP_057805094.1 protein LEO1 homolog [Salvia miltiorrhiza]